MDIVFKDIKEFSCEDLKELFLSVGWSSGQYPEKLRIAMQNSDAVYTAWDGARLIGLMNAMSDGIMNAYFQYLLVNPEYQGKGVGKRLVSLMLDHYKSFLRKTLIAYDTALEFYQQCGFETGEGKTPMSVTTLTT